MLSYTKKMELRTPYHDAKTNKRGKNELRVEYVQMDNRVGVPMLIRLPSGEDIIVDAESLKSACQKIIDIGKI